MLFFRIFLNLLKRVCSKGLSKVQRPFGLLSQLPFGKISPCGHISSERCFERSKAVRTFVANSDWRKFSVRPVFWKAKGRSDFCNSFRSQVGGWISYLKKCFKKIRRFWKKKSKFSRFAYIILKKLWNCIPRSFQLKNLQHLF